MASKKYNFLFLHVLNIVELLLLTNRRNAGVLDPKMLYVK